MKNFLKILEKDFNIIIIEDEVSTEYEAAQILKKYPKDVVILKNIKNLIRKNFERKSRTIYSHSVL